MAITPIIVRDGNNAAQSMSALQDPSGYNATMVSLDTGRATYRAAGNFTPQATNAVTVLTIQGSATKTVRIKRIGLSGVSTAIGQNVFQLLKTSALGAGGTPVTPTATPLDSASPAATAVVTHYTASLKATGTAIGGPLSMANVTTCVTAVPATGVVPAQTTLFPEFGAPIGQAIVLRGAAQYLEVQNVLAANLAAGTVLCYTVEWEEDNS
jgi:hypothetical protein